MTQLFIPSPIPPPTAEEISEIESGQQFVEDMMNNANYLPYVTIPEHDDTHNNPSPGANLEFSKKRKGRPKGSRNKPKKLPPPPPPPPPYVPHGGVNNGLCILEVPHGNDIVQSVSKFSVHKNIDLCVLSASGTVDGASLHLANGKKIDCLGDHVIISMTAVSNRPDVNFIPKPLIVSLTNFAGIVIGGLVVDKLIAKGTVHVIASSFDICSSYHRLPSYQEDQQRQHDITTNNFAGGGVTTNGGYNYTPPHAAVGGIPMYGDDLPAVNGMWRPLPQPVLYTAPPDPYSTQSACTRYLRRKSGSTISMFFD